MFYDIIIIGAGPCGLATAARLREKTPTALFTNDEHARFWKSHRQHHNSLEQELKRRKPSVDSGYGSENEQRDLDDQDGLSIAVLDADSNQWMSQWKRRFADLQISHLRSPLFFHPDPSDRDGLLAFAHENDRMNELLEIPDVVGKELSKHEKKRQQNGKKTKNVKVQHLKLDGRDGIDYYTPSTKLFDDYCDTVIKRYHLQHVVQKARVLEVSYETDPPNLDYGLFTVRTDRNQLYSRVVVVATGPSQKPSIPNLHQLPIPCRQNGSLRHVFDLGGTQLPDHVHCKLTETDHSVNILVIGGGLTSAQLVNLLLSKYPVGRRHKLKVHMLLRHARPKCKPFDIDLPWVSKTRNHLMSTFWSAESDAERMAMFQKARNGGSMTAYFGKKLQKHIGDGRLNMHCGTQLQLDEDCHWSDETRLWTQLSLHRITPGLDGSEDLPLLPNIDHIIFCTGIASPSNGFATIPFLQSLQSSQYMETIGPLPVLTEDLAWSENIPCFFTGALAALRLGPGAGNLGGARLGAERIAWAVEEILRGQWHTESRIQKANPRNMSVKEITRSEGVKKVRKHDQISSAEQSEDESQDGIPYVHTTKERDQFTGSFSNQFAVLELE